MTKKAVFKVPCAINLADFARVMAFFAVLSL